MDGLFLWASVLADTKYYVCQMTVPLQELSLQALNALQTSDVDLEWIQKPRTLPDLGQLQEVTWTSSEVNQPNLIDFGAAAVIVVPDDPNWMLQTSWLCSN